MVPGLTTGAPPRSPVPGLRDHATMFGASFSLLLLQISLTRVLSVVVWYHFAFLTISLVMLGLAVPGVWFALSRQPLRYLPASLLASGLLIPLAIASVVQGGATWVEHSVAWIVLAVLPAMLALGSVICLLLMQAEGPRVGRMYVADLLGGCLGAVLAIPLLHTVPTPLLAASCAVPPLLALALRTGIWRGLALGSLAGLALLAFGTPLLEITRSKQYDETEHPPIHEEWSPTARLTVFDGLFFSRQDAAFSWGRGARCPAGISVRQLWLEQDGSAGTPITQFDGDLSAIEHLLCDVTAVGYQLRPPKTVAVIGAGGGRDILTALLVGADDIDAVELNPHIIDLVSGRFVDVSGDVYRRPGVHAVASEGRSHLTRTTKRYDLTQISLIDSFAASTAGAFALAENSLYTVEAFQLYLRRLTPTGMVSTSRYWTEMPRLLLLARAALVAEGVTSPERHMLLVGNQDVGNLLLAREPFTAQDVRRLDAISRERGFVRVHPPQGGPPTLVSEIIAGDPRQLLDAGIHADPPTDDSPYFFQVVSPFRSLDGLVESLPEQLRGQSFNFASTAVLRQTMGAVGALALLLFALPFVARARREESAPIGSLVRGSLFFAAIGAGFMLLENMLVQRSVLYLGHPSYAVSVVIASLLLGMGLGSGASDRVGLAALRRFGWAVPLALGLLLAVLPALFESTLGAAWGIRIATSCAVLVPLGGMLGLFFPLGMQQFGDADKPWFWAINGGFSVVASVMSLALSMEWGFQVVGLAGAALYVVAWLCLRGGAEPSATR